MALEINIQIEAPLASGLQPDQIETAVRETIRAVRSVANRPEQGSVSVIITDTATVQHLNYRYRGQNLPTDVLSFENRSDPDFPVGEPGAQQHLGDIVIAYPVAQGQAEAHGHSPQAETLLLTVHGTLHLLGFDHDTAENKDRMWQLQREVMEKLGMGHVQPTE